MRSDITDRFIEIQKSKKHPYLVDVPGFQLQVDKNVYPPSEDSVLLAEQLQIAVGAGEYVLDFGTGTGYFALVAARSGAGVVAVDRNPAAIECARNNAKRLGLEDVVDFRLGNSFATIREEEKFDIVAASLPFEAAKPRDLFESSVYDEHFITRTEFFTKIRDHLTEKGRIFFAYADYAEEVAPIDSFIRQYHYKLISEKKSADNELNRVYLITPRTSLS